MYISYAIYSSFGSIPCNYIKIGIWHSNYKIHCFHYPFAIFMEDRFRILLLLKQSEWKPLNLPFRHEHDMATLPEACRVFKWIASKRGYICLGNVACNMFSSRQFLLTRFIGYIGLWTTVSLSQVNEHLNCLVVWFVCKLSRGRDNRKQDLLYFIVYNQAGLLSSVIIIEHL